MEKVDKITKRNSGVSDWAIDGLLYGIVGGIAMLLVIAGFALSSGDSPGTILGLFGAGAETSPFQGLLSHLAVSAIYGVLFGALIWPVLQRFSSAKMTGWFAGLVYGALLLFLAQIAILPGTNSPLVQLPFWQWALGHGIYGLVLGGLFARKQV